VAVGLVDLDELTFGLGVAGVGAWVVFQGELAVRLLDVGETGGAGNAQDLVEVGFAVGVVLLEELFLLLLLDAVLFEELLEQPVGVVHGEMVAFDLVVVVPLGRVGKSGIGLIDLIELLLGSHTVLWVLLGMPLSSEFLVGVLDIVLGGFFVETEGVVVVLVAGVGGGA
jgi:hypothetical protein